MPVKSMDSLKTDTVQPDYEPQCYENLQKWIHGAHKPAWSDLIARNNKASQAARDMMASLLGGGTPLREMVLHSMSELILLVEAQKCDAPILIQGNPVKNSLWFAFAKEVLFQLESHVAL